MNATSISWWLGPLDPAYETIAVIDGHNHIFNHGHEEEEIGKILAFFSLLA